MEKQEGCCIICGGRRQGQNSDRPFVHEKCVVPDKNMLACTRCKRVYEITNEELQCLTSHLEFNVPKGPGVIIQVSYCPNCKKVKEGHKTDVKVFLVQKEQLN